MVSMATNGEYKHIEISSIWSMLCKFVFRVGKFVNFSQQITKLPFNAPTKRVPVNRNVGLNTCQPTELPDNWSSTVCIQRPLIIESDRFSFALLFMNVRYIACHLFKRPLQRK